MEKNAPWETSSIAHKSVFMILNAGFLGQTTLTLQKQQDGTFDVLKPYLGKLGQAQVARLGKMFPAKNKAGQPVEGITKGTFGLFREYDKETKKSLTSSRDCLILTTHKLQNECACGRKRSFEDWLCYWPIRKRLLCLNNFYFCLHPTQKGICFYPPRYGDRCVLFCV
jgi:hypothetical protein